MFLDTLPYNAGATASDALWAGLPVLTCSGSTYVGRMAGALLAAAELLQLITTSLEAYERLALRLATEPGLLTGLRQKLLWNRSVVPLFDIPRFTRDLESAYTRMWETWEGERPPTAFAVFAFRLRLTNAVSKPVFAPAFRDVAAARTIDKISLATQSGP